MDRTLDSFRVLSSIHANILKSMVCGISWGNGASLSSVIDVALDFFNDDIMLASCVKLHVICFYIAC